VTEEDFEKISMMWMQIRNAALMARGVCIYDGPPMDEETRKKHIIEFIETARWALSHIEDKLSK